MPSSLKTLGLIPGTVDKQIKNNKNKDGRKEGREKEGGKEGRAERRQDAKMLLAGAQDYETSRVRPRQAPRGWEHIPLIRVVGFGK